MNFTTLQPNFKLLHAALAILSILIYIDSASAASSKGSLALVGTTKSNASKDGQSLAKDASDSNRKPPVTKGSKSDKPVKPAGKTSRNKNDRISNFRAVDNRSVRTRPDAAADRAGSKILSLLFIVFVLGIACWFVFKKYLPGKMNVSAKCINVVEKASLGKGKGLVLVSVGDKNLLLSMTPEKVSLISEVGEVEIPEAPEVKSKSFLEVISEISAGKKPVKSESKGQA